VHAAADRGDPTDNGDHTSHRPVTPSAHGDRWEQRGEQDDGAADEVVAAEVCRRRRVTDHAEVAAEGVVEAVCRVPGRPDGERDSNPPRRRSGRDAIQQYCGPRAPPAYRRVHAGRFRDATIAPVAAKRACSSRSASDRSFGTMSFHGRTHGSMQRRRSARDQHSGARCGGLPPESSDRRDGRHVWHDSPRRLPGSPATSGRRGERVSGRGGIGRVAVALELAGPP
jgi:hypothetical protein